MSAVLITYDLRSPGQKYEGLHEAIKSQGAWWNYLESTWIVVTSKSPNEVFNALKPFIDGTEGALVVDISGQNYAGWISDEAWTWLKKNVGPHS